MQARGGSQCGLGEPSASYNALQETMDLLQGIEPFFLSYGILVLFFAVMLENAGIPLPGETVLLVAGFYAHQGHFDLALVMAVAAAGAIVGDNFGYGIGRSVGRAFIDRWGRWLLLRPERVAKIEGFFHRHGDKTILVARFLPGLRVFAALFAGMSRMRWPVFLMYNAMGAVLWSVTISLLGYFFGASLPVLEKWIGRTGLVIAGAAGLAVLIAVAVRRRIAGPPPEAPAGPRI